jgi:hypothetical protein
MMKEIIKYLVVLKNFNPFLIKIGIPWIYNRINCLGKKLVSSKPMSIELYTFHSSFYYTIFFIVLL